MLAGRLNQERIARNEATFREANEKIGKTAEGLGLNWSVPYFCECADPGCREILTLTAEEYAEVRAVSRRFLTSPGHESASEGTGTVVSERDGYEIVEKEGHAGEIVEELDHRNADVDDSTGPSVESGGASGDG